MDMKHLDILHDCSVVGYLSREVISHVLFRYKFSYLGVYVFG